MASSASLTKFFNLSGDLSGNVDFGTDGTNTITFNGQVDSDIVPSADLTYDLGSSTKRWQDLYLSGSTIDLGGAKIKADATSGAVAIIPKPTASVANPTGVVFGTDGSLSTVSTSGGEVSEEDIQSAAEGDSGSVGVTTGKAIAMSMIFGG